jgi:hypothetical protein
MPATNSRAISHQVTGTSSSIDNELHATDGQD